MMKLPQDNDKDHLIRQNMVLWAIIFKPHEFMITVYYLTHLSSPTVMIGNSVLKAMYIITNLSSPTVMIGNSVLKAM